MEKISPKRFFFLIFYFENCARRVRADRNIGSNYSENNEMIYPDENPLRVCQLFLLPKRILVSFKLDCVFLFPVLKGSNAGESCLLQIRL